MPQWTTLQDTSIILSPNDLAVDQGWEISEGSACHDPCFAGVIILKNIEVEGGIEYTIKYEIEEYVSGEVYPIVGGVNGTAESSLGVKTDIITVPIDSEDLTVQFYSDGELCIKYMALFPVLEDPDNAVTLGFNASENRWTTYYDWKPTFMLKFINDLFSWNYGGSKLWIHNKNETRNNFYDTQYYSEIVIIFNVNYQEVKNPYSMRVNSNKAWSVENIYIRPIEGKHNGQTSRIKKGNFRVVNGQFMAEFLRTMNDPRYNTELEALFAGAPLQCTTAKITLRSADTEETRLVSVDFLESPQAYTY